MSQYQRAWYRREWFLFYTSIVQYACWVHRGCFVSQGLNPCAQLPCLFFGFFFWSLSQACGSFWGQAKPAERTTEGSCKTPRSSRLWIPEALKRGQSYCRETGETQGGKETEWVLEDTGDTLGGNAATSEIWNVEGEGGAGLSEPVLLGNWRVKIGQSIHVLLPQWPDSTVILMFQFLFLLLGVSLETASQFWGHVLPLKSLSHFSLFGVRASVKPNRSRMKVGSLAKLFCRWFPVSHCPGQQQCQSLWDHVLTSLASQRRKRTLIPVHSCQVLWQPCGACGRINSLRNYMWSLKGKEHTAKWLPDYHRII